MKNIDYYKRFSEEVVYLWNDEIECYVKCSPDKGCFMKFKGGNEIPIAANSNTVVFAIDSKKEVTEKEYNDA